MPLLNYTTEIDPARTVGEILKLLSAAGAASARVDYIDGEPAAVSFLLLLNGTPFPFRLPADVAGVQRVLTKQQVEPRYRTLAQARRVAWRIVKNWIEAQLALIQSGQATLPQLFLPHAVHPDGRTLFDIVATDPHLLLGSGDEEQPQ